MGKIIDIDFGVGTSWHPFKEMRLTMDNMILSNEIGKNKIKHDTSYMIEKLILLSKTNNFVTIKGSVFTKLWLWKS